jgi:uncharacterized damage-inducible protein DinB
MSAKLQIGPVSCLFADNHHMLLQGVEVLAVLPPEVYASVDVRCLGGSIGGHVRHCVEFYRAFLDGLDTGYLNYDARARELRLETDPSAACDAMRQTTHWLDTAAARHDTERALYVLENHADGEPSWSGSSVGRELRFLLSHTVHHYALIAILMRLSGLETPEGFGIAPSTLRHRAQQHSSPPCAQ